MLESLQVLESFAVVCKRDRAVFWDYEKAMTYAAKHAGFVVKMVGSYVKETPNNCSYIRQTGYAFEQSDEQLSEKPSPPSACI